MAHDLHGYLNVLKPPGWTSHDVVARLRRISGQRRIGHTGTLDPAAVGVLPVALGRATRTTSSSSWDRKVYWADVRFGAATDTDDATGRVLATGSAEGVKLDDCAAALRGFLGDTQQRPPAYSAVHVDGRRAYAEARRGRAANLPARSVRVDAISIVAWRRPDLSLVIQCRSGTYIRSIARDLGAAVGCPAHLGALVRLRVGPFDIRHGLMLDRLEQLANAASLESALWGVDVAGWDLDAIITARERALDFEHGRAWPLDPMQTEAVDHAVIRENADGAIEGDAPRKSDEGLVRVYDEDGAFLGLVEAINGLWQPRLAIPLPDPFDQPAAAS